MCDKIIAKNGFLPETFNEIFCFFPRCSYEQDFNKTI